MRNRWWAVPAAAGAVALIAACGSSAAPSTGGASAPAAPAASAGQVSTHSTSKGTVMVDSKGDTIYWFAIDTPTKSNCTGSCLTYWPPVTGAVTAVSGSGLTGTFGTITTAAGTMQATYDGHPLYTYAADTSPGMVSGNGLNVSGGLWWAMTPTAVKLTATAPSGGSSSAAAGAGGGYGY